MVKYQKYSTSVGEFEKIVLENETSLRIILTGRCNLKCEFCIYRKENFNSSEVESSELIDFDYSKEMLDLFSYMRENFGYNTVHLTGGEPTLCKEIKGICLKIKEHGFKINIVTNLLDIETINELCENNCIDELTFSYTPLDQYKKERIEVINNYKTVDPERNIVNKYNIIKLLQKYDIKIKSNIICSGMTDIDDTCEFIIWCWENNVSPRMQRDRSSDRINGSTKTVKEILKRFEMKESHVIIRIPGATEICKYMNKDGNKLTVKVFNQNFKFSTVCDKCNKKEECTKAISSIRIFNKKIGPQMCFCNSKDTDFTVFDLDKFKGSAVSKEIREYRENNEIYFKNYCEYPIHQ